jgi:hypothetical protein
MKPQRAIRWPLIFCIGLLITACAGIPLSTMWRFHSFGPADFAALDPTVIRVAMQTLKSIHPDPAHSHVTVAVQSKGKKTDHYKFSLKLLKRGKRIASLASADPGETWSLFALTPAGIKQFRRLQHNMRRIDNSHDSVSIYVKVPGAKTDPKPPPSVPIKLMLKLKAKEHFITLFDGTVHTGDRAS